MLESLRLQRLWRSGAYALLDRGRQELHKSIERFGAASPPRPIAIAPPADLIGRFFAGVGSGRVPELLGALQPQERDRIIARADAVLAGRFDLLGYRDLWFGDPIDWHLDPCSGRRAPRVHWSRIDALDHAALGDSKVIWELNRHQWCVDLGQAFCFTGDQRYADHAATQLRAWMAANPPATGINWASSLEVALRSIAWCWTLALCRRAPAFAGGLDDALIAWLGRHARHVERYLSRHYSPNTHLTGEALGLFYVGTLFPALAGAERWRELGREILIQQLEQQVLADGTHFERATCYQRYTAEIYLHFIILAARNGVALPARLDARVQALLDNLLAVSDGEGRVPAIGDGDGGWLLPLARRGPDDVRGVLAVAAALFGRADYAWGAGGAAPEPVWLLGPMRCDAPEPRPPTGPASRLFPDGGLVSMRSGWRRAHELLFDVGPLGCQYSAGHGHADLLGVQCRVAGEPQLVDPGTFCYTADPDWRDHFRGSAAHSTITVDGAGQAAPRGPFAWAARPRARLRAWTSTDRYDLADAEHDAYAALPDPVRHRRRVLFAKPDYWVLVDDLYGRGSHSIELNFQFAPLTLELDPDGWARSSGADGRGLLLRCFAPVPLAADIDSGGLRPPRGWVAPDYGCRRPAPQLRIVARSALPLRLVTLLVPATAARPPPEVGLQRERDGALRMQVSFADRRDVLAIGSERLELREATP